MLRRALLLLPAIFAVSTTLPAADPAKPDGDKFRLNLRSRTQPYKGIDAWKEIALTEEIAPKETAILLCDMWDDHWCKSSAKRCDALAKKMEPILKELRARGVTIIHAPSDCMDFYKDAPQRQNMIAIPKAELPKNLELADPPLPIDCKEGGCDDDKPVKQFKAWKRQHEALTIGENDFISDKGPEVYSLLKARGIKQLLVCGVHTNFCVLNRTFAIKQMSRWGVRCMLVRDLTDSMYDPRKAPFVPHDEGTELVIQHIEKHWCPTVLSKDLKPIGNAAEKPR